MHGVVLVAARVREREDGAHEGAQAGGAVDLDARGAVDA